LSLCCHKKDDNDYWHQVALPSHHPKEGIMVEVTPQATEQVGEYFKGRDVSPIRIFLNEGG